MRPASSRASAVLLAGLLTLATVAAEPIVVLRGDRLAAARPTAASEVATYATRVTAALQAAGAPHLLISDEAVTAEQLAGAALVVLPYNRVDEPLADLLTAYVTGGGRLAAFFTTGSERLPALLGVTRGPLTQADYPGQLERVYFSASAQARYPGLPAEFKQGSWHAFALAPAEGTRVLGVWGEAPRSRPAVTENDAGVFVGHVMMAGDLTRKGRFLLSLAAAAQPGLWQPALRTGHQRALAAVGLVQQRWDALAANEGLPAARRATLLEEVQTASLRAGLLPPPTDGTAAGALLETYERLEADARALTYRLAVSPRHELRGLWVFGSAPIDWPKVASQARDAGLNAIFYRVGRGGSAVYPSALLPQEAWSKERDEVALAIETCHRYGLEFHAWRVCYHLGSAPQEYVAQLRREGRLCCDSAGRETLFANPAEPRNAALELAAIQELAERYAVDGIHLDYIRYPDDPGFDFDYSATSRREFERHLGAVVADWPADVLRGSLRLRYDEWQRANIDGLVMAAARTLRELQPAICFSAAVWRNPSIHRFAVKQDWPRWVAEGWLDLVVPMDYLTDAAALRRQVAEQVALTAGRTPLAAGLGAWLLDQPADLVAQVEAARAAGAGGFVLFSNHAPDLSRQLAALREGVTSLAATPATAAPPVSWRLPQAISRGLAPLGVAAGSSTAIELLLGPGSGTRREALVGLTGTVQLVQPESGRLLAEVGRLVAFGSRAEFNGHFPAPKGLTQLQVEGTMESTDGQRRPFLVRGPLVEGLDAGDLATVRARLAPPVVAGRPAVGVWRDGLGSEGLLAALPRATTTPVVAVDQLKADHLAPLDHLVLTQMHDVTPLYQGGLETLRSWVRRGGTLLLTHDAVGFRWHPPLFWELARGDRLERQRGLESTGRTPGWAAGERLEHAYQDHVLLLPQPGLEVLFTATDGVTPVIAAGPFGQGRVIFNGTLSGAKGDQAAMPREEARLVLALLGLAR